MTTSINPDLMPHPVPSEHEDRAYELLRAEGIKYIGWLSTAQLDDRRFVVALAMVAKKPGYSTHSAFEIHPDGSLRRLTSWPEVLNISVSLLDLTPQQLKDRAAQLMALAPIDRRLAAAQPPPKPRKPRGPRRGLSERMEIAPDGTVTIDGLPPGARHRRRSRPDPKVMAMRQAIEDAYERLTREP